MLAFFMLRRVRPSPYNRQITLEGFKFFKYLLAIIFSRIYNQSALGVFLNFSLNIVISLIFFHRPRNSLIYFELYETRGTGY